jgi:hypothetical protein
MIYCQNSAFVWLIVHTEQKMQGNRVKTMEFFSTGYG